MFTTPRIKIKGQLKMGGRQKQHKMRRVITFIKNTFFGIKEIILRNDDWLQRALARNGDVESAFFERQQIGSTMPCALRKHA